MNGNVCLMFGLALLFAPAFAAPPSAGLDPVAPGPGEWAFRDYVIRHQTGGRVDMDIRGERATADASHTLWLDTAVARWMAHSKPYINITAARARVPEPEAGARRVDLEHASAVLYLGGRFESDSLSIDLLGGGDLVAEARGEVWFERQPVVWRATAVRVMNGFERILGEKLALKCGGSSASADAFAFDLESRRLDLFGNAVYISGQRVMRRDRLTLKFNSQFTELSPAPAGSDAPRPSASGGPASPAPAGE